MPELNTYSKMRIMLLIPASEVDYPAIVRLANRAYRGDGRTVGWNIEAGYLEGQRLDESLLQQELAAKPRSHLLIVRDDADVHQGPEAGENPKGELTGMVWLHPISDQAWHLGLLTIRPESQSRGLGRTLLAAAEEFARQQGARRMYMSVIHLRDVLIAWYERHGYRRTGETEPFPYGDERFGRPTRDDLHFVVLEKEIAAAQFPD